MQADFAVIGMGVMGGNIALNLADQGHVVAIYNRSPDKVQQVLDRATNEQQLIAIESLEALKQALQPPRKVMLMLTAGKAVDAVIEQLLTILESGDIIIDGGNSSFHDSERRWQALKSVGIGFLGVGISGGEEGARHGPSIMPGGEFTAWQSVEPILQSIAARTDNGEPCCQWVGDGGAGHYVKMIHNGIEYGDMQLIAESWQLLQSIGADDTQIADSFARWNEGVLQSYLIEITARILRLREADGELRVHRIVDSAGQKGTGRWTAVDSLELGAPLTLISEAVYARMLSALREQRQLAAQRLAAPASAFDGDIPQAIADLHDALYAARIISYTQGFMQMRMAAAEYGWRLEYGNIALLWRAGCIIRSRFLDDIKRAFDHDPDLDSLLLDDFFADAVTAADTAWRNSCSLAIAQKVPMPSMQSALAFYDGYRSTVLPANLLQAQRDFFGAHSYRRIDRSPRQSFHTRWATDGEEELLHD